VELLQFLAGSCKTLLKRLPETGEDCGSGSAIAHEA